MVEVITLSNIVIVLKCVSVIGFLTAVLISYRCYYRTRMESYTWLYILLAMMTSFILCAVRLVKEFIYEPSMLELIKVELIPVFTVFLIAASFTIKREKGFPAITPVRESDIMVSGEAFTAGKGQTYLIMEEEFDKGINMFMHSLAGGYEGLLLSRICPADVRERLMLKRTPCIWLTETSPKDILSLGPELEKMLQVIEDFIKKTGDMESRKDEETGEFTKRSGKGVIYIGGLDYLIEHNSFDRALFFVERLTDKIRVSNCILIISVNPYILNESQKKLLEREANLVETGDEV
ncbi:MAG: DUF835 domain-containing protein [Candidatus Altiarchaeota archaeon]|nr:DUF835 domain-containing protein [Candidatus Altiarchaeota archaeon]